MCAIGDDGEPDMDPLRENTSQPNSKGDDGEPDGDAPYKNEPNPTVEMAQEASAPHLTRPSGKMAKTTESLKILGAGQPYKVHY